MAKKEYTVNFAQYKTKRKFNDDLPSTKQRWRAGKHYSAAKDQALGIALKHAISYSPLKWPKRRIFFIADAHGDAEAFAASMLASGGVSMTGPTNKDITLTKAGQKGLFIIGGDCLDKGPSSLELLRSVRNLMTSGARVKLLAGNHDMRLLMGLRALSLKHDTLTEHFFVRMGPKIIPLLKEIHSEYLIGKRPLSNVPDRKECRRILFPSANWFEEFPAKAQHLMSKPGIKRETKRMREKINTFEASCKEVGLTLPEAYATAIKCKELFLKKDGEFAWFFRDMQLAYREGSLLFIHAGLDDQVAHLIEKNGVSHLNRLYKNLLKKNLFEFYYGSVANTLRTKYRDVDKPFSRQGAISAFRQGIHFIIHGHRNLTNGQRIMLRKGMVHIESDITMDRNSRKKEGLDGYGVGVTIIDPDGKIIGISTDYAHAKIFKPSYYFQQ